MHIENATAFLRDATSNHESAKFVQSPTDFLTQNMEFMDADHFCLLTMLLESVSAADEFFDELVE